MSTVLLLVSLLCPLASFDSGGLDSPKPPGSKIGAQQAALTPEPRPESAHFYKSAKPYTRWWWFASEIKKEDIVRQLDWLKKHNFGGVEVAWVYPLNIERYATRMGAARKTASTAYFSPNPRRKT